MKGYYRVMLGAGSVHAQNAIAGNFIGADFGIKEDLGPKLSDDLKAFNQAFIPAYLAAHPGKTKIAAGLGCGFLWTVAWGIKPGDAVLCPDGTGVYRVGEVTGGYKYEPDGPLPHRRSVRWLPQTIAGSDMSQPLKNSMGLPGTVSRISSYRDEIDKLIGGNPEHGPLPGPEEGVEDPYAFAMETHLEDFLVKNWAHTDLGENYDIFVDDDERVGRQYPTDTGPLDLLAVSKDRKQLLVVELKKGRASDAVVGQALRYMGWVKEQLAQEGQSVTGAIIALDDDPRIRRAISMVPEIDFYRYQISFKLVKG